MMVTSLPPSAGQMTNPASQVQLTQHHLAYQRVQQQQMNQLHQTLQMFRTNQYQEIAATSDFKNHSLPLARIKKIMKADEDVRMIAAEVPVLFARACEMFILELTYRSWAHAEENKRRTLQKNDIAGAITRTDVFDFLVDIVPIEDVKEDVLASISTDGTNESLPYYYVPSQAGSLKMMMNNSEVDQSLVLLSTLLSLRIYLDGGGDGFGISVSHNSSGADITIGGGPGGGAGTARDGGASVVGGDRCWVRNPRRERRNERRGGAAASAKKGSVSI
ncbi:hypothetical protein GW17_00013871, partial [Ensete ventricosum]